MTSELRQAATFALYCELGLHREVAKVLDADPPLQVSERERWQARSELLWEQGRWGTLRWEWRAQDPAQVGAPTRTERIGACWWVQGRLLPAYLWLTWHRRRCPDPEGRLLLAETEGRVLEAHGPDPGMAATRAGGLAAEALRTLGKPQQRIGIHLYQRRSDLASSLESVRTGRPRDAAHATTASQWFTEAGNLRASLSYRHRLYRDTYDPSASDEELARRYRALSDHYRLVDLKWRIADPAASRSRTGLRDRRFLAGTIKLQFGWWHRPGWSCATCRCALDTCAVGSQPPRHK